MGGALKGLIAFNTEKNTDGTSGTVLCFTVQCCTVFCSKQAFCTFVSVQTGLFEGQEYVALSSVVYHRNNAVPQNTVLLYSA